MDTTADSEINGYSPKLDHLDGTPDMNLSNTISQEKDPDDFPNLSDISVSSADTYTPKMLQNAKYMMPIEITNWEPLLIDDKLVISGNVAGPVQMDRVCKQRLSSLIFKDDDGVTCCILGPMKAQSEVPEIIRNQFKYIYRIEKDGSKIYKDGIPENWFKLCSIWKCYIDTVNKDEFDWSVHYKKFSYQPLNQVINVERSNGKINNNRSITKIKRKYEKYKSMLEQEQIRDTIIGNSESDTDLYMRKKSKKKNVINQQEINGFCRANIQMNFLEIDTPTSSSVQTEQSSLNKRTSCYINNQIPTVGSEQTVKKVTVYCQTDLTLNDFMENDVSDSECNDKNQSSNVTILSPTKPFYKSKNNRSANCAINDQLNKKTKNESNQKIITSKTILKDLTNNKVLEINKPPLHKNNIELVGNTLNKNSFSKSQPDLLRFHHFWKPDNNCNNLESNDDSSSVDFYENIAANSTAISAKTPGKQATCQKINYICSKTLERFANRTSISDTNEEVENVDVIDIDLFSQTVLKSQASTDSTINETVKADPKELKTLKNNLEKTLTTTSTTTTTTITDEENYELRSPKQANNITNNKGLKRKSESELNDEEVVKNVTVSPTSPVRVSLRKRKKLNYRELLFSKIKLPENSIIDSKVRKSVSPLHKIKKTKKQLKTDEKLFKKCFVILMRENLESKQKNANKVISTSNFTVTNVNIEKENVDNLVKQTTATPQTNEQTQSVKQKPEEHVFKTPLATIVKKNKTTIKSNSSKLNRTVHIPNYMPKITKNRKKLSLPGNALEMWKIIQTNSRFEKPLLLSSASPSPSPFSILSDTSSDSNDKKRRKLFSPDNWMQSDGCLKTLSQNEYHSSDSRFSIRFDDTDQNLDSELSDSGLLSSY